MARGEQLNHETSEKTTAGESVTNIEKVEVVSDQTQKYKMAVKAHLIGEASLGLHCEY